MSKYRIPSDYKNDVSKATHNWRSSVGGTIHCGFVYPVHHRHLEAGDRVRGPISLLVQSEPMRGPLRNGFKLNTIGVFLPDSVLYTWRRNGSMLTPDIIKSAKKFYFDATEQDTFSGTGLNSFCGISKGLPDTNTSYDFWIDDIALGGRIRNHVCRGGLWDWLGVPPGTVAPVTASVSASVKWDIAPFMTYLLACYYYVVNVQEGYMYSSRPTDILNLALGFQARPGIPFNSLFRSIAPRNLIGVVADLQYESREPGAPSEVFNVLGGTPVYTMMCDGLGGHGGLVPAPYSPDLFGNIIKSGESPVAKIPVINDPATGDVVAVPTLRFQTKIQNVLDRLFVSGGRFGDVLRTLWGTNSRVEVDKPDFVGVWQTSINPSNVVAQSSGSASGEETNLGQMAARIDRFSDFNGSRSVDYYAKESGTLMFLTVLVPDPSYAQGLHPDLVADTFSDDFNPEMNGIGFVSVPRHRFSTMPGAFNSGTIWVSGSTPASVDPNTIAVGEEVAWSWLRTDYPRLHGEFAQNGLSQYWVLTRNFTEYFEKVDGSGEVTSVTANEYTGTYINPLSWQYLFVGQTMADPNFILLADFDLTVTSSVSGGYMPYLGR